MWHGRALNTYRIRMWTQRSSAGRVSGALQCASFVVPQSSQALAKLRSSDRIAEYGSDACQQRRGAHGRASRVVAEQDQGRGPASP